MDIILGALSTDRSICDLPPEDLAEMPKTRQGENLQKLRGHWSSVFVLVCAQTKPLSSLPNRAPNAVNQPNRNSLQLGNRNVGQNSERLGTLKTSLSTLEDMLTNLRFALHFIPWRLCLLNSSPYYGQNSSKTKHVAARCHGLEPGWWLKSSILG